MKVKEMPVSDNTLDLTSSISICCIRWMYFIISSSPDYGLWWKSFKDLGRTWEKMGVNRRLSKDLSPTDIINMSTGSFWKGKGQWWNSSLDQFWTNQTTHSVPKRQTDHISSVQNRKIIDIITCLPHDCWSKQTYRRGERLCALSHHVREIFQFKN